MAEIVFTTPGGATASILFDATVEEVHEASVSLTEHPVESGGDVADHVRPNPDTITLEAVVSNTPLRQPLDGLTAGAAGAVQELGLFIPGPLARSGPPKLAAPGSPPSPAFLPPIPGLGFLIRSLVPGSRPEFTPSPLAEGAAGTGNVSVLQFSSEFNRVQLVHGLLLALQRTGTLVSILTSLRDYDNMILESVTAPRDATTANAVQFGITARQVRLVSSETVVSPEEERAVPRNNRGNQGPEEADAAETEEVDRRSLAMRLIDMIAPRP